MLHRSFVCAVCKGDTRLIKTTFTDEEKNLITVTVPVCQSLNCLINSQGAIVIPPTKNRVANVGK